MLDVVAQPTVKQKLSQEFKPLVFVFSWLLLLRVQLLSQQVENFDAVLRAQAIDLFLFDVEVKIFEQLFSGDFKAVLVHAHEVVAVVVAGENFVLHYLEEGDCDAEQDRDSFDKEKIPDCQLGLQRQMIHN